MPIKLIGTVLVVAIVGIFCGFNMSEEYRCSINLIFYKTPQIPVFLTIICSFIVGILVMTPFSLIKIHSLKKEESKNAEKNVSPEQKTEEKKFAPDSEPKADFSTEAETKTFEQ